jgi:hypothetical protein
VQSQFGFPWSFVQGSLNSANGCFVDFTELSWATEFLLKDFNRCTGPAAKPFQVWSHGFLLVIGKKENSIEGSRVDRLGDWTEANLATFKRCSEVCFAEPGDKDFSHSGEDISFLASTQEMLR